MQDGRAPRPCDVDVVGGSLYANPNPKLHVYHGSDGMVNLIMGVRMFVVARGTQPRGPQLQGISPCSGPQP